MINTADTPLNTIPPVNTFGLRDIGKTNFQPMQVELYVNSIKLDRITNKFVENPRNKKFKDKFPGKQGIPFTNITTSLSYESDGSFSFTIPDVHPISGKPEFYTRGWDTSNNYFFEPFDVVQIVARIRKPSSVRLLASFKNNTFNEVLNAIQSDQSQDLQRGWGFINRRIIKDGSFPIVSSIQTVLDIVVKDYFKFNLPPLPITGVLDFTKTNAGPKDVETIFVNYVLKFQEAVKLTQTGVLDNSTVSALLNLVENKLKDNVGTTSLLQNKFVSIFKGVVTDLRKSFSNGAHFLTVNGRSLSYILSTKGQITKSSLSQFWEKKINAQQLTVPGRILYQNSLQGLTISDAVKVFIFFSFVEDVDKRISIKQINSTFDSFVNDIMRVEEVGAAKVRRFQFSDLIQFEMQNVNQILRDFADLVTYVYYVNEDGIFVFEHIRYNDEPIIQLDGNDLISWNFTDDESKVITAIHVKGAKDYIDFSGFVDANLNQVMSTSEDKDIGFNISPLFGIRLQNKTAPFLRTKEELELYGKSILLRAYGSRFGGTITIPFSPEIRLGTTIWLKPFNRSYYVTNVNHNIQVGGLSTSTVSLLFGRAYGKDSTGKIVSKKYPVFISRPGSATGSGTLVGEKNRNITDVFITARTRQEYEVVVSKDPISKKEERKQIQALAGSI